MHNVYYSRLNTLKGVPNSDNVYILLEALQLMLDAYRVSETPYQIETRNFASEAIEKVTNEKS